MQTLNLNEKPIVENKRYAPRWGSQAHFVCRTNIEDAAFESHIKDLSCSGACLSTDQQFTINQNVNLTLFLSDKGVVRTTGTVMWTEIVNFQKRVGIRFFNTSSETQETILKSAVNGNKKILTDFLFKDWASK